MSDTTTEPAGNLAIRPIKDQVLVRQDPIKEKLASGLYVPEMSKRVLQDDFGTVIAVGPGRDGRALEVKPGDYVMFKRKPDSALIPDPREGGPEAWKGLVMLREDDILGVVEGA